MNFQKFNLTRFTVALLVALCLNAAVSAQDAMQQEREPSTIIINNNQVAKPVAGDTNLYCAGFIQSSPIDTSWEIVGAVDETNQRIYAQNDNIYINAGASRGVRVGDMFAVVRPRGQVETRWTRKNNLGFYVQEVGAVEVIDVKGDFSVARVKTSCDNFLLGDLLQPMPQRVSPMFVERPALDIFASPTGKSNGRIVMARYGLEMVGRDQIVYIDLGAEDNVRVGDYLTIYRPLGSGGIIDEVKTDVAGATNDGFQSEEYRGGKFSNQSARKKGNLARGEVVTTEDVRRRRPQNLRRIVGEMVILNVKEKTATAVIVRTAAEIHTGDRVELQ